MNRSLARLGAPFFLLAVLTFFLPFYGVSCQGNTVVSATGYEIATSGFRDGGDTPKRAREAVQKQGEEASAVWLLAFPLLAAAAAACGFLGSRLRGDAAADRGHRGRAAALGAAAGGVLLLHYIVLSSNVRSQLAKATAETGEGSFARGLAQMVTGGITLELEAGWWLSLLASLAGTALLVTAWLMTRQPDPAYPPPRAPRGAPAP